MTRYMTHVEFTDLYAKVPFSDDGIGAWLPLTDGQRMGAECIDCGAGFGGHEIGTCEDGPLYVCAGCYQQRLFDHIDHYRPQS